MAFTNKTAACLSAEGLINLQAALERADQYETASEPQKPFTPQTVGCMTEKCGASL